jgi:hypothetical protein
VAQDIEKVLPELVTTDGEVYNQNGFDSALISNNVHRDGSRFLMDCFLQFWSRLLKTNRPK